LSERIKRRTKISTSLLFFFRE